MALGDGGVGYDGAVLISASGRTVAWWVGGVVGRVLL